MAQKISVASGIRSLPFQYEHCVLLSNPILIYPGWYYRTVIPEIHRNCVQTKHHLL